MAMWQMSSDKEQGQSSTIAEVARDFGLNGTYREGYVVRNTFIDVDCFAEHTAVAKGERRRAASCGAQPDRHSKPLLDRLSSKSKSVRASTGQSSEEARRLLKASIRSASSDAASSRTPSPVSGATSPFESVATNLSASASPSTKAPPGNWSSCSRRSGPAASNRGTSAAGGSPISIASSSRSTQESAPAGKSPTQQQQQQQDGSTGNGDSSVASPAPECCVANLRTEPCNKSSNNNNNNDKNSSRPTAAAAASSSPSSLLNSPMSTAVDSHYMASVASSPTSTFPCCHWPSEHSSTAAALSFGLCAPSPASTSEGTATLPWASPPGSLHSWAAEGSPTMTMAGMEAMPFMMTTTMSTATATSVTATATATATAGSGAVAASPNQASPNPACFFSSWQDMNAGAMTIWPGCHLQPQPQPQPQPQQQLPLAQQHANSLWPTVPPPPVAPCMLNQMMSHLPQQFHQQQQPQQQLQQQPQQHQHQHQHQQPQYACPVAQPPQQHATLRYQPAACHQQPAAPAPVPVSLSTAMTTTDSRGSQGSRVSQASMSSSSAETTLFLATANSSAGVVQQQTAALPVDAADNSANGRKTRRKVQPPACTSYDTDADVAFLEKAKVSSIDEALQVCVEQLDELCQGEVIAAIHLVAKFAELDAAAGTTATSPTTAESSSSTGSGANMSGTPSNGNGNGNGNSFSLRDPRFMQLLARLKTKSDTTMSPRHVMRVLWALGKLSAFGKDADTIVGAIHEQVPPLLPHFTSMELSNSLWGLARLTRQGSSGGGSAGSHGGESRSSQLAAAIVAEGTTRVHTFSAQCLSNSLWALAKLELSTPSIEAFCRGCIGQLRRNQFRETTPQGFANSLWAVAKLRLPANVAVPFCVDAARYATDEPSDLSCFMTQELSMALWAMAKVLGRRQSRNSGNSSLAPEVEKFAVSVAEEGAKRLPDFSPQGLSNIAWALATLELTRLAPARTFVLEATARALPELGSFPPQAIANFCWALGRVDDAGKELATFGVAAGQEALRRESDFSWQDLAGIISSMIHKSFQQVPEAQAFAAKIAQRAATCCSSVGNQALLNIALSCVRLSVPPESLRPMAWGIAEVFTTRMHRLNDIDLRQWMEVQRYCGLPGTAAPASSSSAGAAATRGSNHYSYNTGYNSNYSGYSNAGAPQQQQQHHHHQKRGAANGSGGARRNGGGRR